MINNLEVQDSDVQKAKDNRYGVMVFQKGKLLEIGNESIDQYIEIIHTELMSKEGIWADSNTFKQKLQDCIKVSVKKYTEEEQNEYEIEVYCDDVGSIEDVDENDDFFA